MAIKMTKIQQKYNFVKSFFNSDKFENSLYDFSFYFHQYCYPLSTPIILEVYRDFTLEVHIFFSYKTNKIVVHYQ